MNKFNGNKNPDNVDEAGKRFAKPKGEYPVKDIPSK